MIAHVMQRSNPVHIQYGVAQNCTNDACRVDEKNLDRMTRMKSYIRAWNLGFDLHINEE